MSNMSFTAFEMLFYSLISALYLFNGYRFTYTKQLTLSLSLFFFGQYVLGLREGASIMSLPFWQILVIAVASITITYAIHTWAKALVPVVIQIVLTTLCSIVLSSFFFPTKLFIYSAISIVVLNLILILLPSKAKSHLYISISAVCGAILLSTLFTLFYYFSKPVHIILCIVLCIIGLLVQESSERKDRGDVTHD